MFLGYICGIVLNKAKGREMVTGFILSYFINGIYQFVVLLHDGLRDPREVPGDPAFPRLRHPQHA